MRRLWRWFGLTAALGVGTAALVFADRPSLLVSCTRSSLCSGAVVMQFEEASDYPRRPLLLEPEGANVSPIGAGSQKLNNYAVQFTGSNFLWSQSGGVFPGSWFTIAMWVYPTTAGSSGQAQTLVSEDGDNQSGNTLDLYNAAGAGIAPRIRIRDGIDPKNGPTISATWGSNISLNSWHLIVARLRPKTFISNGELSVQVDNGTPVTSAVSVATWGGGGRLFVGKTNTRGSENYYTGYMDQLAIAGIRWTDQETGLYWNAGAGLQYPFITGNTAYSTPTSHWRFDRLTPRILDDAAGFNDASVAGGNVALGTGGPFGYSADFTAGYVSAASANFDPSSLSPTLWLKADTIGGLSDGGAIGTWADQSGNGRDFTQNTAGAKPTYKTGILNGLPVVRFDGTTDYMTGPALSQVVTTSAHTIFTVFVKNAAGNSFVQVLPARRAGRVSAFISLPARHFDRATTAGPSPQTPLAQAS